MNIPVFDLHCDTALALLAHNGQWNLQKNGGHIDLNRARKLRGYCQCFACFTTPFMQERMHISPETVFEKELEILRNALQENPDIIRQAFSPQDVEENLNQGVMSAIFTIEGPAGFKFDPGRVE